MIPINLQQQPFPTSQHLLLRSRVSLLLYYLLCLRMALTGSISIGRRFSTFALCVLSLTRNLREYPVAPERSGNPADFVNYVSFMTNLKKALGSSGHNYGLTLTYVQLKISQISPFLIILMPYQIAIELLVHAEF